MNEKNLVICDREFPYADHLASNITSHSKWAVKVCVCSNMEHVLHFRRDHTIHLLIIDESYLYEQRKAVMAEQTFVLCKTKVSDLGQGEAAIRKYRCADDIIQEIFELYTEKTNENLLLLGRKEPARVIGVYSPIHRIGKSTFAKALGKEYARKKATLYISLEEYPALDEGKKHSLNLGDILYYVKQGSQNLAAKLQSAVQKMDGLDYLLPIPVLLDFKEVRESEWQLLLEQIIQNSSYERIILDFGESLQGLFPLLESCHRIYMPILKDPISEQKIQCFERNQEQLKMERLPHITHRFVMPENIEEYAKLCVKEEG